MTEKLTNRTFAMHCSYMAKRMSGWAGDVLCAPDASAPVNPAVLERFIQDAQQHLDWLKEDLASASAFTPAESKGAT